MIGFDLGAVGGGNSNRLPLGRLDQAVVIGAALMTVTAQPSFAATKSPTNCLDPTMWLKPWIGLYVATDAA